MDQAVEFTVESAIRRFVYIFCNVIWAAVGFLYWVPLLARSCGAYTGAVILAIIGRTSPNTKAAKMLDVAANFYSKGFDDIHQSLYSEQRALEATDGEDKRISIFSSWEEFFHVLTVVGVETAIAVLFWGAIILLIAHIF
ncbi:MAG: hypothetical protein KGJ78_05690 [Alphaproteobacteria bacterium]|nr:hypothetical protein [Alphaproteobacteria bacterium]